MKKVMVASLLSAVAFACVTPGANVAFAQAAAPAAAAGQVQLSPAEYADYTNATGQTAPAAKAAALEAYLTKYPQSAVKLDVLQQLMFAYSTIDAAKTIDAADRILQLDPNNIRALISEVAMRGAQAGQLTDPAARQTALDSAATFGQKGIDALATKPASMSDADYTALKGIGVPRFYSAIGSADLNKKDYPGAIAAYTAELKAVPVADTTTPGPILQDTFYLGQAYYASTPSDLVNCTFFTTRAAVYAPDSFKPQLQPTASYCYKKYHGNADGYDAVVAAAKANLFPPADFSIVPAPKASDIAHKTVVETPDLATLAIDDKEFIIQNGSAEDAGKVWDTIKGKSVQIPGALVIESSPTVLKVAVSADAVQSKTADFTFNLKADDDTAKKTPAAVAAAKKKADDIAAATAVGQKVNVEGTYTSYTANPFMITMDNAEVVLPKKAAAPVHHAPAHKR